MIYYKIKSKSIKFFTLVELMVSMFLFLIIMGIVARYFAAANQAWRVTARKNEIYANARVALDLITRDLQSAMYSNSSIPGSGIYPFYHSSGTTSTGEWLCFISQTPLKPKGATSNLCEIRYSYVKSNQTVTGATGDIGEFWLMRSCTADNSSSTLYNFVLYPYIKTDGTTRTIDVYDIYQDSSSELWKRVISNVLELKFDCYIWDTSTQTYVLDVMQDHSTPTVRGSNFPQRIRVSLTVMDDASMAKYRTLRDRSDSSADDFMNSKKLTFTKTVYMNTKESF